MVQHLQFRILKIPLITFFLNIIFIPRTQDTGLVYNHNPNEKAAIEQKPQESL